MQMVNLKGGLMLVGIVLLAINSTGSFAHGDVTPQPVDTEGLKPLGEEWQLENPYRGDELAIEIGTSAYAQNCARCHGLDAVSGGTTPDLRLLNDEIEWTSTAESDGWFLMRVRTGAVKDGRVYMPPFEGILNQEAMWAIRSYLDTRPPEE